nr:right-handed parallel beta-helix repeat-containing protein [Mesorhizobium sp.]
MGWCRCCSRFSARSRPRIRFKGGGIIKAHSALGDTSNLMKVANNASGKFVYDFNDIEFEDIEFDGANRALTSSGQNMFRFWAVDGLKFRRCRFRDWQRGVIVTFGCKNIVVDDCDFTGWGHPQADVGFDGGSAFYSSGNLVDFTPSENVQVLNSRFRDGYWNAMQVATSGFVLANNVLDNIYECGIFAQNGALPSQAGTSGKAREGVIANNVITEIMQSSIDAAGIVASGWNLIVTGNRIEGVDNAGISATDSISNVKIAGNIVSNSVRDPGSFLLGQISVRSTDASTGYIDIPRGVFVDDNIVRDAGQTYPTGTIRFAVRCVTTANITLSGLQTIDGMTLIAGKRVLVKDQTNATENGIYITAAGAWPRATDVDTGAEIEGSYCIVLRGATNGRKVFKCTSTGITIGSTDIVFAEQANTLFRHGQLFYTQPVHACAAAGNITLSGTQTIDGVACGVGDRVLAPAQTDATQRGVWIVAAGSWTRAPEAESGAEMLNSAVYVLSGGTTYGNTRWRLINTGTITVGSTSLICRQLVKVASKGIWLARATGSDVVNEVSVRRNRVTDAASSTANNLVIDSDMVGTGWDVGDNPGALFTYPMMNTVRVLGRGGTPVALTGTTTETNMVSVEIPPGVMGLNGKLRIRTVWSYTNSANDKLLRARFGTANGLSGTALIGLIATTSASVVYEGVIANQNSASVHVAGPSGGSLSLTGQGISSLEVATAAINTTGKTFVNITAQLENAGETITLDEWLVELIPS